MKIVPTFVARLFSVDGVVSAEEQSGTTGDPLVGTPCGSKQLLVEFDEDDSYVLVSALSTDAGAESAEGEVGACAPAQRLSVSYLAPPDYSNSNPLTVTPTVSSPVSSRHTLTEQPTTSPLHQPDHPPPTGPSSTEIAPGTTPQILQDLRLLATWPRLRDATVVDPTVGGVDFDPTGVADRLGLRGLSVYTAFIEDESFRCHVCGHRSSRMALALLHQRHQRHFQR